MNNSNQIGISDKKITEIINFYKGADAAPHLFEQYRISGLQQDDFVAALIIRLCLSEVKHSINVGDK